MPVERSPFWSRPLSDGGIFSRLRGRPPKSNALIELENRLAEGVMSTFQSDVSELEIKYGIDFSKDFANERERLYQQLVRHLFSSPGSRTQPDELPHLQSLLLLRDEVAREIRIQEGTEIYRAAFTARISDRRLDDREESELQGLQTAFDLSDSVVRAIRQEEGDKAVRAYLNRSIEDASLSPSEVKEVERSVQSMGISFQLTPEQRQRWDRFRLYWRIQNAPLSPVGVSVNLQRDEVCYFEVPASWHERRQQTRTIRYSGPQARIRIAKGLYWRTGSVNVSRVTEEVLHTVDDVGTLYFTNKRVLYTGRNRNTNVRLNRVLDFEIYSDGIELQKDSGRNPVFLFGTNLDIAALTLNRLLSNDPPPDQGAVDDSIGEVRPAERQISDASLQTVRSKHGHLDGRHYTEYVEEIKQMKAGSAP